MKQLTKRRAEIKQNIISARPVAPVHNHQINSTNNKPDPASALRADHYPIPSFFEYRIKNDFSRI